MNWVEQFDGLNQLEPAILEKLSSCGDVVEIKKNTTIFGMGATAEHWLMLLDGTIQVRQVADSGREIVLYRVDNGHSCVLSTACVLAYEDNSAKAIAETDLTAVLIPKQIFEDLMGESKQFRHFVLSAFSKRFTDLFHVIEEVAFKRIDHRLAQKLIDLSKGEPVIKTTHQKLASELGSVREVISRQMSEFQTRGWIEQHRGKVEILDREKLVGLAAN